MCLSTDEKYTELIEAINSLDCKEDIIEVQNKEKDDIITAIMDKYVVGNPRVWWLAFKKILYLFLTTTNFNIKELINSLMMTRFVIL